MMNLAITGGSGFIGANFIRFVLEETDFEGRIVNIDKLTYAGNPENLADIRARFPERYLFERVDICDAASLTQALDRHGVDAICHFAAESHVDRSIEGPAPFIHTNILGTYHLLEWARGQRASFCRFHHVSTDEVFGSLGEEGYFTETTAYAPNSPYSASKAASDHLVRAYHHTFGVPVTLSNCSNNYGPYQFPEKLIPLMILNAAEGASLPVYGDGMNVRDWLFVRDHCRAVWDVINRGREGETYNVGGRTEMPNIRLVEMICDELDARRPTPKGIERRRELITFVQDRPGHDRRYAIDCTKIEDELGWRPEETLATGLARTIEWYLDNSEWVRHVRSGAYREWIEKNYGARSKA